MSDFAIGKDAYLRAMCRPWHRCSDTVCADHEVWLSKLMLELASATRSSFRLLDSALDKILVPLLVLMRCFLYEENPCT